MFPIILLLSLVSFSKAQSCLSLTGSQACPAFSNYQILANSNYFTNVTSFDAYIISHYDNNAAFISDFQTRYSCPGYTGTGARYHISSYCGMFVDAATTNGCNTGGEIQVCPYTINAAISSLQSIFNDTSFCSSSPASTPASSRTSLLALYSTYSSRISTSPLPSCVQGFSNELPNCGFFTHAEGLSYCKQVANDPCCANLTNNTQSTTITNPAYGQSNGSSSSSNTAAIVGGCVGGFIAILIIIFIVLYMHKRAKETATPIEQPQMTEDPIQIAETYEVLYNYVPNLSDEIYLYVGDKIIIKVQFDDGWALGYNLSTKQEGTFPIACVSPIVNGAPTNSYRVESYSGDQTYQDSIRQRGSSLYVPK